MNLGFELGCSRGHKRFCEGFRRSRPGFWQPGVRLSKLAPWQDLIILPLVAEYGDGEASSEESHHWSDVSVDWSDVEFDMGPSPAPALVEDDSTQATVIELSSDDDL